MIPVGTPLRSETVLRRGPRLATRLDAPDLPDGSSDHEGSETGGDHRRVGEHRDFLILECGGRLYGVPQLLGPVYLRDGRFLRHPAVVSSADLDDLKSTIDRTDPARYRPRPVEQAGDYRIVALAGRYYGLPRGVDDRAALRQCIEYDPLVLEGTTLEELREAIARAQAASRLEVLGKYRGYQVVRCGTETIGLPPHLIALDVRNPESRCCPGVVTADCVAELHGRIDGILDAVEVEFAGWVPAYIPFGNCGTHPQYSHIDDPPPGYRFLKSDRALIDQAGGSPWRKRWVLAKRLVQLGTSAASLFVRMLANRVRLRTAVRFLLTRDVWSQLMLPADRDLTLLPTVPYSYSQSPWVLEIEDVITLFYPYFHNGHTHDLAIREATVFNAVKTLLETPNCRGILTHMRATADGIPKLFQSETIARKVFHVPMGVEAPLAWQQHEPTVGREGRVQLLFTNSWHQGPVGFYPRGGLDVLEAFALVKPVHPELHLVLRTKLPDDLPQRYRRIISECNVQVLDKFLRPDEFDALLRSSHVYLLPAARIHIVSLLQAMSYGLVPVVSDGWGMQEYVEHCRTGLVVEGRYGKVSWQDEDVGLMREDYRPMYRSDPQVVQGLVDSLSALVDDARLRQTLGHAAREDVVTRFNRHNWNRGLKAAFDAALGRGGPEAQPCR